MKLTMIALAAAVFSANGLLADVTYNYTGSDFNTVSAPYTTSDLVTGTITFATPLADNLSFQTVTPLSLTLSDGQQIFNLSDAGFSGLAELATDGSGNITQWFVLLQGPLLTLPDSSNTRNTIETVSEPGEIFDSGHFYDSSLGAEYIANGDVANGAGAWTLETAAAPEPRMVVFMLIGMFVCAGARALAGCGACTRLLR